MTRGMSDILHWGRRGYWRHRRRLLRSAATFRAVPGRQRRGFLAGQGAQFAARAGIDAWSDGLSQLLADSSVEAVYIATPHPRH